MRGFFTADIFTLKKKIKRLMSVKKLSQRGSYISTICLHLLNCLFEMCLYKSFTGSMCRTGGAFSGCSSHWRWKTRVLNTEHQSFPRCGGGCKSTQKRSCLNTPSGQSGWLSRCLEATQDAQHPSAIACWRLVCPWNADIMYFWLRPLPRVGG